MPEIFSPTTPYWSTTDNLTTRIYLGDVREVCSRLPARNVQMVVTSPPYFGLRDYKTGSKLEIGSEPIPDCMTWGQAQCGRCYVCTMVEVFRSVRRVLRDDGTLWLNLGDTYAGSSNTGGKNKSSIGHGKGQTTNLGSFQARSRPKTGLKSGNLIGIPWRVALALQNDGWILRQEIIWHKPNPMPDSVKNRCTKAHDQIFLLTKSDKYYFDNQAIREKDQGKPAGNKDGFSGYNKLRIENSNMTGGLNPDNKWEPGDGANKRSVWVVPTAPYKGCHYATFPPKLITPCILAGTSEKGCCMECGTAWKRRLKPSEDYQKALEEAHNGQDWYARSFDNTKKMGNAKSGNKQSIAAEYETVGWEPMCQCNSNRIRPCMVIDPFLGSGTTAEVCIKLKRYCLGIELSQKYVDNNAIPRISSAIQNYRPTKVDLIPDID